MRGFCAVDVRHRRVLTPPPPFKMCYLNGVPEASPLRDREGSRRLRFTCCVCEHPCRPADSGRVQVRPRHWQRHPRPLSRLPRRTLPSWGGFCCASPRPPGLKGVPSGAERAAASGARPWALLSRAPHPAVPQPCRGPALLRQLAEAAAVPARARAGAVPPGPGGAATFRRPLAAILGPGRGAAAAKSCRRAAKTLLAEEINFVEIHSPEISYNYKAQGAECFYNTAVLM